MRQPQYVNLVIDAAQKLGSNTPEWRNLLGFLESCYTCRVREYDLDAALAALATLTDEVQHALIAWVVLVDDLSDEG